MSAGHRRSHNIVYVLLISFVASFGGLLIGFDSSVISGVVEPISHHFQLSPAQTGWAVSSIIIGSVAGCYVSGYLGDLLGRKKALILTALIFIVSVAGTALTHNYHLFVVFRIIGGLAMGLATVISTIYIAEVAPKDFRGTAITMQTISLVGGQVVVLIINYAIAGYADMSWLIESGWRWMLASALIPSIFFLALSIFIPETPRWNMMAGKEHEAVDTLTRIANGDKGHAERVVAEIKASLQADILHHPTKFTFDKRSAIFLIIGMGLALFSQLTGIEIIHYYGPSLLMNVTGDLKQAMFMTILLALLQFVGVVMGMRLVDRVGRTVLLKYGAIMCSASLLYTFIAFYFKFPGYWSIVGLLGFTFSFGISWAHAIWTVIGEIFPTRMRAMGAGISLSAMYIGNFAFSQTFPIMNKNAFLLDTFNGGFPMLLCALFCLMSWFFVKFWVPETKGVSLEKMEDWVLSHASQRSKSATALDEVK